MCTFIIYTVDFVLQNHCFSLSPLMRKFFARAAHGQLICSVLTFGIHTTVTQFVWDCISKHITCKGNRFQSSFVNPAIVSSLDRSIVHAIQDMLLKSPRIRKHLDHLRVRLCLPLCFSLYRIAQRIIHGNKHGPQFDLSQTLRVVPRLPKRSVTGIKRPCTGSWMGVLGKIGVKKQAVRWNEHVQSHGNGENAKGLECRKYSSVSCFLWSSDRPFHFQATFAMNQTFNRKAGLVLSDASSYSYPATCDEFKCFKSEEIIIAHCEKTKSQVLVDGIRSSQVQVQQSTERWKLKK